MKYETVYNQIVTFIQSTTDINLCNYVNTILMG